MIMVTCGYLPIVELQSLILKIISSGTTTYRKVMFPFMIQLTGKMYFGDDSGFNVFHPDSIKRK